MHFLLLKNVKESILHNVWPAFETAHKINAFGASKHQKFIQENNQSQHAYNERKNHLVKAFSDIHSSAIHRNQFFNSK